LFDLCQEKKTIKECQMEVKDLYDAFSNNDEIIRVLSSCFLAKSEKAKIVDTILVNCEQKDVINFVKVIIDNGRERHILKIFREFDTICNDYLGIKTGTIYSPYKISQDQIKEIEKVVSKRIGFKVKLKNEKDASLIGGVKVVVGDYVFDNSLRNKLDKMHSTLLKGGN